MKACTKCGEEKPIKAFKTDARARDGHGAMCKACDSRASVIRQHRDGAGRKQYLRAWYAANRGKARVYSLRWYRDNPEKSRASRARWVAANPERYRRAIAEWGRKNPEAIAAKNHRRRIARIGSGGHVSAADIRDVMAESLGICAYCGERKQLTLDHIESLSRGGLHHRDNLAAACLSCNSSKQETPLVVWLAERAA